LPAQPQTRAEEYAQQARIRHNRANEPRLRFAADSPVEGGVRCELVSAAGPTPPYSFIAGLMNS
jgi:hypothetical protein